MKEFLDKLSSYNIFNYLLPGILFAVTADRLTSYSLISENLLIGVFVYYFIGLVISRIGSLVLEPFLKKIRVVEFASYSKFIQASKLDVRLEILSETNNTYRNLSATFLCLLGLFGVEALKKAYPQISGSIPIIICVVIAILFVLSYRKQTNYIKERIVIANKTKAPVVTENLECK